VGGRYRPFSVIRPTTLAIRFARDSRRSVATLQRARSGQLLPFGVAPKFLVSGRSREHTEVVK
jgi:hypothetical protein